MQRVYVAVNASFDADGRILPRSIVWTDGQEYEIDRVTEMRQAASLKVGGQGDRYTIYIHGRQKYLFFERSPSMGARVTGRWFVEGRA